MCDTPSTRKTYVGRAHSVYRTPVWCVAVARVPVSLVYGLWQRALMQVAPKGLRSQTEMEMLEEIDCIWLFLKESEGRKCRVRRWAGARLHHSRTQYRRKDTLEDASTRLANQTTVLKDLTQPKTDRREMRI